MATNGLVLIKPTSTAVTGGSASATINAGGSVTFTTCESLSLNGVFTADYDNYMIVMAHNDDGTTYARMRASGTDNSTANSYTYQLLNASNTTVSGSRTTSTLAAVAYGLSTDPNGNTIYVYGPYLAQPTAGRSVNVNNDGSARIVDWAWTHNQSTSYDGISFFRTSIYFTMSGLVKVYGLVK